MAPQFETYEYFSSLMDKPSVDKLMLHKFAVLVLESDLNTETRRKNKQKIKEYVGTQKEKIIDKFEHFSRLSHDELDKKEKELKKRRPEKSRLRNSSLATSWMLILDFTARIGIPKYFTLATYAIMGNNCKNLGTIVKHPLAIYEILNEWYMERVKAMPKSLPATEAIPEPLGKRKRVSLPELTTTAIVPGSVCPNNTTATRPRILDYNIKTIQKNMRCIDYVSSGIIASNTWYFNISADLTGDTNCIVSVPTPDSSDSWVHVIVSNGYRFMLEHNCKEQESIDSMVRKFGIWGQAMQEAEAWKTNVGQHKWEDHISFAAASSDGSDSEVSLRVDGNFAHALGR
ncbi:hypothetical protein BS50DRAFT_641643 [Corynespora cassiicola Philippines]|uniref:Uncharacterized protein n=1 Tax=Corynespora cassiicola Philippines TaxID=1448308 RepID=A0A2T2MZE6_CORCC|nr:hypothetical protein BS50DRAFT_641643 [Corynespora cassiicola Philippines]